MINSDTCSKVGKIILEDLPLICRRANAVEAQLQDFLQNQNQEEAFVAVGKVGPCGLDETLSFA